MDEGPSTLDFITLGIALWGAIFATYLGTTKRRRRLRVTAHFGTARLGKTRNHGFFVLSVVNVGERAVTIREIEWEAGPDLAFTGHVFRHSKGRDLPVQVEADEEVRILFDIDFASKAIAELGATAINVDAAGRKRKWRVDIPDSMRDEANEHLEWVRELQSDD